MVGDRIGTNGSANGVALAQTLYAGTVALVSSQVCV